MDLRLANTKVQVIDLLLVLLVCRAAFDSYSPVFLVKVFLLPNGILFLILIWANHLS